MLSLIKLLTWIASPLGLLLTCSLVAGLLRLLNKAPRTRLTLLLISITQLLMFAWPPVAYHLSQSLEARAKNLATYNSGGSFDAILLLGGGISPTVPGLQLANAHEAFDRVLYAARLYHQGLAPHIIVSGGSSLRDQYPTAQTEAAAMADALSLMGVPQRAILLEDQSLTTRQNMAYTAALLQKQGINGRLALVTSATHLPRAYANAQRYGLNIDAYPTDWVEPIGLRPLVQRWLPNAQALEESERAAKEWMALLMHY